MRERTPLVAATAMAIALVIGACESTTPTPAAPSLDGTWYFSGFVAAIAGDDVTVTVGDGTMQLSMDPTSPYAAVTQIVVKGVLAVDGMAYKLTLSDEADAITVMPPAAGPIVAPTLKGVIEAAQLGTVMITVDEDADPNTIKVAGSFIVALASALGSPVTEVVGCKGAPCATS